MKVKNKKVSKFKLPNEVVETLRKRGGAHGSQKGKRGYNRKREKILYQRQDQSK